MSDELKGGEREGIERGIKRIFIFFCKNILWNEKNVVPLHAVSCASVCRHVTGALLLINF